MDNSRASAGAGGRGGEAGVIAACKTWLKQVLGHDIDEIATLTQRKPAPRTADLF
jgi:hypothetical protein